MKHVGFIDNIIKCWFVLDGNIYANINMLQHNRMDYIKINYES